MEGAQVLRGTWRQGCEFQISPSDFCVDIAKGMVRDILAAAADVLGVVVEQAIGRD